jgi:hypothetical protein
MLMHTRYLDEHGDPEQAAYQASMGGDHVLDKSTLYIALPLAESHLSDYHITIGKAYLTSLNVIERIMLNPFLYRE